MFKGVARASSAPRVREALARGLADLGYPPLHLVSQGSVALALALSEMRARRPDRNVVVVPAYCCPSVPNTVRELGLALRAVPVTGDLNMQVAAMDAALADDVLAVVAAHMYGLPVDVETIRSRAHAAGAYVVDDAAHVVAPARVAPRLGTRGDVGLLSFHHSKTLTGGSPNGGGALIVSNPLLAEGIADRFAKLPEGRSRLGYYAWFVLRYGIEITPRALSEYMDPIDEVLHAWFRIGDKAAERMSAAAGLVVTAQLGRLETIRRERARIIAEYADILRGVPELQLAQGGSYAALTRIVVRWRGAAEAADVREKLARKGFATRLAYPAWTEADDPVTPEIERIGASHLELPAAPSLQRRHLESVVRSLAPLVSR